MGDISDLENLGRLGWGVEGYWLCLGFEICGGGEKGRRLADFRLCLSILHDTNYCN